MPQLIRSRNDIASDARELYVKVKEASSIIFFKYADNLIVTTHDLFEKDYCVQHIVSNSEDMR